MILIKKNDVARLQVATQLISAEGIEALCGHILDTVMAILHADLASLQMFYPEHGSDGALRLLCHRGFSAEAAKRWEWVDSSTRTTCGEALRTDRSVMVADVRRCDFMAESEDLRGYLAAGILAGRSTPLISRSGALVGMVSTYWLEPHELSESEQLALDVLARQAADLIERSRAEEKLRKSEELLRSTQRLAHVGSWEWDFKSNEISWSDELFDIFGQPRDYKPSYEDFLQAVVRRDRKRVDREVRAAVATKRGFSSQVDIIRPDGERRTISFIAEVQLDHEDMPLRIFGATHDITDFKKNEAELRALTARLVDLQESNMRELARELHDDLCQNLGLLSKEISDLRHPSVQRSRSFSERMRALERRTNQMAIDVHTLSTRLHPAIVYDLGLKAALKEECRRFSAQTGIPVSFKYEGESRLPAAEVSLCFYRVAQEALNNIFKHARATQVDLTFSNAREGYTLRIADNGQGFDTNKVRAKGSLGLISIKERTQLVNGTFAIKSELGKGTTLDVFVAPPAQHKSKFLMTGS